MSSPVSSSPPASALQPDAPELTIVVPTFNERDNITELALRLDTVLAGIAWEMLVVDDDSPDGTSEVAKALAQRDPRIRCIRRVGRRGLSGACIEGMLASASPYIAVMDADLQHDETILPQMFERARQADIVIGTRYVEGGSAAGLSGRRQSVSTLGGRLARLVIKVEVSDPMSGFFMLKRELVERLAPDLSTSGFKILADILSALPADASVAEVPYTFRDRHSGDSKLDAKVLFDYLGLLLNRMSGGLLPVRFLMFALVGGIGLVVHLLVLRTLISAMPDASFTLQQGIATLVAMIGNFAMNNSLTYRDARLKGLAYLRGLVLFCLGCSIGAIANIGVATWVYGGMSQWWFAGVVGALMGAVWNYAASNTFVWRKAN